MARARAHDAVEPADAVVGLALDDAAGSAGGLRLHPLARTGRQGDAAGSAARRFPAAAGLVVADASGEGARLSNFMAMPGRRPVRCELPHPCGHPAPDCGDMAERWAVILVCMNRTGLGEVIRRRTMS